MHIMLWMASGRICWVQAFWPWRGYGTAVFGGGGFTRAAVVAAGE